MSDLWDKIKNGGKITSDDLKSDNDSDEGLTMVNESLGVSGMDEGLETAYYSALDDEEVEEEIEAH